MNGMEMATKYSIVGRNVQNYITTNRQTNSKIKNQTEVI